MSEIEPLPDGLKDLFAAEKSAPVFDSSIHSVMRARLAAIVGKTPLGHAVAGSVLGGAGKALAIIAITVPMPKMMPSIVRIDRTLFRHSARNASLSVVQTLTTPPASALAPVPAACLRS